MRKLLGGAAVVAGFGVLGYVGTTNHAERMEQEITDLAGDVSGTAVLPVDARVSGRDVTVTGQAMDQAELDALRGAYEQIEGVRVVNVDGVALLPVADPFEITLSKDIGGDVSASGSVPSYTAQAGLGAVAADLPLGRRCTGRLGRLGDGRPDRAGRAQFGPDGFVWHGIDAERRGGHARAGRFGRRGVGQFAGRVHI